jgi:hypothetical protein
MFDLGDVVGVLQAHRVIEFAATQTEVWRSARSGIRPSLMTVVACPSKIRAAVAFVTPRSPGRHPRTLGYGYVSVASGGRAGPVPAPSSRH